MTSVFPEYTQYKIGGCTSDHEQIVINSIFHRIDTHITSAKLSNLLTTFLGFKDENTFVYGVCAAHSQHTLYINQRLPDDFWFHAWLTGQKLWWGPRVLSLINSIDSFDDYIEKNSARIRYFCKYYDLEQIGEFIVRVLTAIRDTVLQKTRPHDRQLYGRIIDLMIRVITHSIAANNDACDDHLTDNPDLETPVYEFLYHNNVIARRDDGRRDEDTIRSYAQALGPEMTWLNDYYEDPESDMMLCCQGLIRRVFTRLSDDDPQKIIILRYKNGSIITIPEKIMAAAAHPKRTLLVYTQSGTFIDGIQIISSLLSQRDNNWNRSIELLNNRYFSTKRPNIQPIGDPPFMMIVIYSPKFPPHKIKSVQNVTSIPHKIAMFVVNSSGDDKIALTQEANVKGYTAVMFYTSPQTVENLDALDPLFTPSPPDDLRVQQSPPNPRVHQQPPPTDEQQITTLLSLSMLML